MNAWPDELRSELDASPHPVDFFFRDDDAGWDDERLFTLLDLFARRSMPIDVAAIPCAMTRELAAELRARIAAAPDRVGVHQHGFAHVNHETEGRKCEFGGARDARLQRQDIEAGRRLLAETHGLPVGDIFTPPWNRCAAVTGECLRDAGFRVLSRDVTAPTLGIAGLRELPVGVDWLARRKGVRLSPCEVGKVLANSVRANVAPVGVMFHHAAMDADELRRACELLDLLATHTSARAHLMSELLTDESRSGVPRLAGQTLRPATLLFASHDRRR